MTKVSLLQMQNCVAVDRRCRYRYTQDGLSTYFYLSVLTTSNPQRQDDFITSTHCARHLVGYTANDDFLVETRKVNTFVANFSFLYKIVIAVEFRVFFCQLLVADLQKNI